MRLAIYLCSSVAVALSLSLSATPALAQQGFAPIAGWDQQLFPSYLLATATMRAPEADESKDEDEATVLGDARGVLGIAIESPADDTPITVTVECDEILESSTYEGDLESAGTVYEIKPNIRYRYKSLAQNKQATPITITYTVTVGDEEPEVCTATATLRSVNDCPYAIIGDNGELTDISFMFAAYVNEQHPFVDKVLREALDDGVVTSFTGYQSGDPAEVYRQVYALWHALAERDVRYSNITTTAAASDAVHCQHVRLIDESINNGQANCVDGSVLLASLLRKIDIEPVLVYLPNHCYLGFYLDEGHTQLIGLETTLIGDQIDDDPPSLPGAKDVVDDEWSDTNSWRTFCAAVAAGNADLKANRDKFDKDDPDYQRVSIAEARQNGILPIAFDASCSFKERSDDAE